MALTGFLVSPWRQAPKLRTENHFFIRMLKRGVEFKGGSLHDGFESVVLESTWLSFCLSYKIQQKGATVTILVVLAVMAVSIMTPLPTSRLSKFSRET